MPEKNDMGWDGGMIRMWRKFESDPAACFHAVTDCNTKQQKDYMENRLFPPSVVTLDDQLTALKASQRSLQALNMPSLETALAAVTQQIADVQTEITKAAQEAEILAASAEAQEAVDATALASRIAANVAAQEALAAAKKSAAKQGLSKVSAKPGQKTTKAGSSKAAAAAKRRLFADAYIANGGNATQAGIACGLSEATAGQTGARMLKHAEVQARIAERQQILAHKYELTAESVIRSLAQAVHFDPRKMYREDGTLKPIQDLDDDTAAALTGLEITEETIGKGGQRETVGYTKKVKWLDKNQAREQAMKHLGLYKEDNKQRSLLENVPRETLKALVARLGG